MRLAFLCPYPQYNTNTHGQVPRSTQRSCFINCVIKIATKKRSTTKTPQQQVELFVKKYFGPLAEKRKTRNVEDELFILEPVALKFSSSLKECFMFFATIPSDYEKNTLKRHEVRRSRKKNGET